MILDDLIDLEDQVPDPEVEETEEILEEEVIEEEVVEETPEEDSTIDDDAVLYYNYLVENNLLDVPEDFKFDGEASGIQEAINLTKARQLEQAKKTILESLPPDFQPLLQYGLAGGSSLEAFLSTYAPKDLSDLDTNDPISQKAILTQYYKLTNPAFDDSKINRMVSRLETIGDLKEEAEDALAYMLEHQEQERAQFIARQEAEQRKQEDEAKAYVETLRQTIKGSKDLTDIEKNAVEAMLFNPYHNSTEFDNKINSAYSNPEHFIQLVSIFRDYDPKQGFTFERLKKRLKTDSNKSFAEILRKQNNTKSKLQGRTAGVDDDFDFSKFTG